MTSNNRPSRLAISALLFCTLVNQAAWSHWSGSASFLASSSEVRGRINAGTAKHIPNSNRGNHSHDGRLSSDSFLVNSSQDNTATVSSERSGEAQTLRPDDEVSPLCAYRVIEGGIWGQLCFRHTLFGYKCHKSDCRTALSFGNLVANILINGSVLLQWSYTREVDGSRKTAASTSGQRGNEDAGAKETSTINTVFGERRHRRGGFEMSCWWNGSYTQFECASVHLGQGCRDLLLDELHENIPYRICLRSLIHSDSEKKSNQQDCVEFTLPPSGMQDIVIAMTTVGGAICVMLVIICLLVAYITENIMSPTTQQQYSYRTRSRN